MSGGFYHLDSVPAKFIVNSVIFGNQKERWLMTFRLWRCFLEDLVFFAGGWKFLAQGALYRCTQSISCTGLGCTDQAQFTLLKIWELTQSRKCFHVVLQNLGDPRIACWYNSYKTGNIKKFKQRWAGVVNCWFIIVIIGGKFSFSFFEFVLLLSEVWDSECCFPVSQPSNKTVSQDLGIKIVWTFGCYPTTWWEGLIFLKKARTVFELEHLCESYI